MPPEGRIRTDFPYFMDNHNMMQVRVLFLCLFPNTVSFIRDIQRAQQMLDEIQVGL